MDFIPANLIAVGDEIFQREAIKILANNFKTAFINTMQLCEQTSISELSKQIKRIARKFEYINNQRQKLISSLLQTESLDTMR